MSGSEHRLWRGQIVRSLLIISFIPFGLLGASLLVLPFFLPLFLIKGFQILSLYIFIGLIVLLAIFIFFFTHTHYRTKRRSFLNAVVLVMLAGIIVHTAFNLTGVWILRQTVKRARTEGIKLRLEEVIPQEIPDEHNAAIVWSRAFGLYDRLYEKHKELLEESIPQFNVDNTFEELSRAQKNSLSKLLLENPEFITLFDMVEEAVSIQECRFPLNYEDGPFMLLPHLSKLHSLSRFLALRTYLLAQRGDYNTVWTSFITCFSIGDTLETEPAIISQLARFSLDNMAMGLFQKTLLGMDKDISVEKYRDLTRAIDGKKSTLVDAWGKEAAFIGGYVYGDIFEGHYRRRENFIPFLWDTSAGNTPRIFWRVYPSYLFAPLFKRDAAFYLDILTRTKKLLPLPFYIIEEELRDLIGEKKTQSKYPLAGYLLYRYGWSYPEDVVPEPGKVRRKIGKSENNLCS